MLFRKKKEIPDAPLPKHIAIVMDGNGRWAKKRGLPRTAGHSAGARNFRRITRYCSQIGIKYLTVYAFSTENWKRPQTEVKAIMTLFRDYLKEALRDFRDENIRTRFIGDRSVLDRELIDLMSETEALSAGKTGMVLNIAINYGGRQEMVYALREIAGQCAAGELTADTITEETVAAHLDTRGQPDPDILIRPSGEMRISNFLLWQSAYSEFIFDNILWPDFKPHHVDQAIKEFWSRNRRYGGITKK